MRWHRVGLPALALLTSCVGGEISSPKVTNKAPVPNIDQLFCRNKPCDPIQIDWQPIVLGTGGVDPCDWQELRAGDTVQGQLSTRGIRIALIKSTNRASECVPNVSMACTPNPVAWGETVECTVSINPIPPGAFVDFGQWHFHGPGDVEVEGPANYTWSGKMIVSGFVDIQVIVDNWGFWAYSEINVNRRTWSWANEIGGRRGNPGEIDQCFDTETTAAMMEGQSCTSSNPGALFTPTVLSNESGYSSARVQDYGPNSGLWYLGSATATMQLRSQIARNYRADGDPHPMVGESAIVNSCVDHFGNANSRNTHVVNTECQTIQGFLDFIDFAWNHEEATHMSPALAEGRKPASDVHLLWESVVVQEGPEELLNRASIKYTGADDNVQRAAKTHTGDTVFFSFRRFLSNANLWPLLGEQWHLVNTGFRF